MNGKHMKNTCRVIVLISFTVTSNVSFSAFVLGEAWESKNVSGFTGKKTVKLNFGEVVQTATKSSRYKGDDPNRNIVRTHKKRTTYAGLKKISWTEYKNRPCKIQAIPKRLNYIPEDDWAGDHKYIKWSSHFVDFCNSRLPYNYKTVALPMGYFSRGIAVCMTDKKNSKNNRVKGIRLYQAKINEDGKVVNLNNYEENDRTNCWNNWHKAILCPAGKIITGLNIHKKGEVGKMYMTGIGIKCRGIKHAESPFKE